MCRSGSVCTTNEVSDLIERLQYDLGEGPCVDAYQQDRPVLEPDLARPRHVAVACVQRAGHRRGRESRLWLSPSGRSRTAGCAQPVLRPARSAHRRATRRRAGHGRHRGAGRPRAAGRRAARQAGRRARGGRRLPVRGASGRGHGRRPARRQRRPSTHPPAGACVRQRPLTHRGRRGRRRKKAALR